MEKVSPPSFPIVASHTPREWDSPRLMIIKLSENTEGSDTFDSESVHAAGIFS